METQILWLRLFVGVLSQVSANEVAMNIRATLQGFGSTVFESVRPYWKIPAYFEILLKLAPLGTAESSYARIRDRLGRGWIAQGPLECIWTPGDIAEFSFEEVKWAHLEAIAIDEAIETAGS